MRAPGGGRRLSAAWGSQRPGGSQDAAGLHAAGSGGGPPSSSASGSGAGTRGLLLLLLLLPSLPLPLLLLGGGPELGDEQLPQAGHQDGGVCGDAALKLLGQLQGGGGTGGRE